MAKIKDWDACIFDCDVVKLLRECKGPFVILSFNDFRYFFVRSEIRTQNIRPPLRGKPVHSEIYPNKDGKLSIVTSDCFVDGLESGTWVLIDDGEVFEAAYADWQKSHRISVCVRDLGG